MPITRKQSFLNSISGGASANMSPITREEQYLAYIAGESNSYPSQPITREEFYLDKIAKSGVSGGSGVNVQSLSVTENGTYTAPSGVAYSPVFVDVQGGGSGESVNKLPQVASRTVTEITAEDLEGATVIGGYFFSGCQKLGTIEIPNSVTKIFENAFQLCYALTNIEIPNSVTSISNNVFLSCTKLASITIGNGITTIGNGAFMNCQKLKSVTIKAETPPTIQSNTFSGVPADCAFYVPAASVEAYKAATNWSARADYIFPIEE